MTDSNSKTATGRRIEGATTTLPEAENDRALPDEIEVTPDMVEAGMLEYGGRWRGLRDAEDDIAREMLVEAYKAMYRLRP
jgi:hypothetical protein